MGEPIKIFNLVTSLIQLSGYRTEKIGIKFSALPPGRENVRGFA
ncbi:hypothetical protein BAOM_4758 [Peribacillus asahii]|uniref:Uncharacterized protein n=1 Tax=Peribacillus asahii TaxID=228899 RepID=A0A3Q9RSP0_9BACI|nr:hypothetical protein BAOM_4758 [Peribacillus asahii]